MAKGETQYKTSKITEHLKTNAYVVSKFLDREITIKENRIRIQ
jgi:RNA 3'-terminal phosphate cyclase